MKMIYISEIAKESDTVNRKVSSFKGSDYYVTSDGQCFRLPSEMETKDVSSALKSAIKGHYSKAKAMSLYIVGEKPYVWLGDKKRCLASQVISSFTTLGEIKPSHILFIDGDVTNCSLDNLAVTDGRANTSGKMTTIKTKAGGSVVFRSCSSAAKTFGYSKSYLSKIASSPTMEVRSGLVDAVTLERKDA